MLLDVNIYVFDILFAGIHQIGVIFYIVYAALTFLYTFSHLHQIYQVNPLILISLQHLPYHIFH